MDQYEQNKHKICIDYVKEQKPVQLPYKQTFMVLLQTEKKYIYTSLVKAHFSIGIANVNESTLLEKMFSVFLFHRKKLDTATCRITAILKGVYNKKKNT